MFGSSIIRGLSLSCVALLALGIPGGAASAGGKPAEAPPVYEDNYTGPPIIRRIPGLRILFGDYKSRDVADDQLDQKKKKKKQIDESYYEPLPAMPKEVKPPAASTATTLANPALPQKTASAAPVKPLPDGLLSCEQATEVVSGYGFSSVEAFACSGKVYAFNAKRDGKTFAIKFDPASGQLTEVRKMP